MKIIPSRAGHRIRATHPEPSPVVVGVICFAVIALLLFFDLRTPSPRGSINGFHALDGGGAVIVWCVHHKEGRSTGWVTRVDASGREVWTRSTPEEAMSGGTGPLSIVDGTVVVRYGKVASDDEPELIANAAIAFDLADGKTLWDRELAKYTPHKVEGSDRESRLEWLPLPVSDLAIGKHLVSFSDAGKVDQVTSIVARTGELVWQRQLSVTHFYYSPVVIGDTLSVLHQVNNAWMVDAATGEWRYLDVAGSGCSIENEYITVERHDGVRLVAHRPGAAPRIISEPFNAIGPHARVDACGRYKEQLVFLIHRWSPDEQYAVVITDLRGQLLHEIVLGGRAVMEGVQFQESARGFLAGDDLPRYVPYPEVVYDVEEHPYSLLMLDLETGTIAWRGRPDPHLYRGLLFRAGSRWIWSDNENEPVITIFDGTTGRLVGAVAAYGHGGIKLGSPRVATRDTLWIHSRDWTSPDGAPLAALDLATLRPRFPPHGMKLTDVTADVREKLGL